jgi:malate synthase
MLTDEVFTEFSIPDQFLTEDGKMLFPYGLGQLLVSLHQRFEPQRQALLQLRKQNQANYDAGVIPSFPDRFSDAVTGNWMVEPVPEKLLCRRVEITGPVSSSKMVIQMLGRNEFGDRADTAMLDFEDSMKPDFQNVLNGYRNVIGAVNGTLTYIEESNQDGKSKTYSIDKNDKAYVMVRVRGLHLNESHVKIFGTSISAGLLDLIVCFFHTYKEYLKRDEFPKFYIPKCEHFLEARWWNEVFSTLEDEFDLIRGTIKVTFLIETLPATLQVEEILFEIKDHAVALNVGRWDKIFSDIKIFQHHPDRILADRATIDMSRPWMENYAKRVIKICHNRGAFAIGGMAAFIPGKKDLIRHEQRL